MSGTTGAAMGTTEPGRGDRRIGMEEIDQGVRAVVAAHAKLSVDVSSLAAGDDLFAAGMTSHASVSVMLAVEDAFGVEFPQAWLKKTTFQSIGTMAEAVRALVGTSVPVAP